MKKLLAALATSFAITLHSGAAVLTPGTLADYLALGPGGGTIGSTTFFGFTLQPLQTGATAISPASVFVTPINVAGNPSLQFDFTQSAAPGALHELHLAYQVASLSILGASVALGNATAAGDAVVTAVLALTGPTPQPPSLIALESSFLSIPSDATAFASVAALSVDVDIVADGGLAGQSSIGRVTNSFAVTTSAVPDGGATLLLLAMALGALGLMRRQLPIHTRG